MAKLTVAYSPFFIPGFVLQNQATCMFCVNGSSEPVAARIELQWAEVHPGIAGWIPVAGPCASWAERQLAAGPGGTVAVS